MPYFRLLSSHREILAFGFTLCFFSSFGQTFFIALFGAEIRNAFGLTHGSFGALYSTATLISGFCLIWVGGAIDRFSLRRYTRVVVFGLLAAALVFATAPVHGVLVLGIFMLRLFGQGLMGHTAMTTMARFFSASRGKAMSVAALGFPAGEAVLPRIFVGVKDALDWRGSWLVVGALLAVVLIPFVEWLFRHLSRDDTATEDVSGQPAAPLRGVHGRQWARGEVLRDPRFFLVLPSVLAPPFIATGIFFHQVVLAEEKGWSMEMFATTFAAYAAAQLTFSLVIGPVVDRLGAARILPFYLVPLGVSLLVLALGGHPAVAFLFMLLAGMTGGMMSTVIGAYWAETYGVKHLGAIRSIVMALMVFSTAAAPVLLGVFIDRGTTMETIALAFLVYTVVATLLAALGERKPGTEEPAAS